jgi:glycosyltransferase involved in cell wall biosynthesis
MKVCIVGKYPPIEGGVSTETYWLARGLASRGHEIHVVTNANEVEERFKLKFRDQDSTYYSPMFQNGGRVLVYNVAAYSRSRMYHIPEQNPFVTKLAGLAAQIVAANKCDVILGYYLEPYAIAAHLVSQWTQVPLVIKHAGSDVDRLFRVDEMATTYAQVCRSASRVVTVSRLRPRFRALGLSEEQLQETIPYAVPTEIFRPDGPLLDVATLRIRTDSSSATSFDESVPAVGIYGKIGASKGTFDLLDALSILRSQGSSFCVLAMIGAAQVAELETHAAKRGLLDRTFVLPLTPNWRVPEFLRRCACVCVLEREFGVKVHRPVTPREVMACGVPLMISAELAKKHVYGNALKNEENCIIIDKPQDHAALAVALSPLLVDAARRHAIGNCASQLARDMENRDRYLEQWESILQPGAHPRSSDCLVDQREDLLAVNARYSLIRDAELLRMPPEAILPAYVDRLVTCDFEPGLKSRLQEYLAYISLRHSVKKLVRSIAVRFMASDHLERSARHADTRELRPVRGTATDLRRYSFDVAAVRADSVGSVLSLQVPDDDTSLLLIGAPNGELYELKVDHIVGDIINGCDGTRTVDDLAAEISAHHHCQQQQVLDALDWLHTAGAIAFGKHCDGWGWANGARLPG